jgi:hypothetical protein
MDTTELVRYIQKDKRIQNAIKMLYKKKHFKDSSMARVLDDLTVTQDGILMRNNQIVIPKALYKEALAMAHKGHQGLVKTCSSFHLVPRD